MSVHLTTDLSVEISTDMPPEQIDTLLRGLQNDGILDYVLPTDPIGERWVLGMNDQILNFDTPQTVAFLIGHQSTLHWIVANIQRLR